MTCVTMKYDPLTQTNIPLIKPKQVWLNRRKNAGQDSSSPGILVTLGKELVELLFKL